MLRPSTLPVDLLIAGLSGEAVEPLTDGYPLDSFPIHQCAFQH